MAVIYPLNLAALKRTVDTAEQMVLDTDQTSLTIEQRLNLFGQAFTAVKNAYNTASEANKTEFNAIVDQLQLVANDLNTQIAGLDIIAQADLDTISSNLTAVKALLENDTGVTVLNTLDALADAINASRVVKPYVATINDATGKATVDITALGLTATTDYSVTVSQNVTAAFAMVTFGAKKVDVNTIEVVAYDQGYTPETKELYVGTTTPAVFEVVVAHLPTNPISINLTETDGDTANVGNA